VTTEETTVAWIIIDIVLVSVLLAASFTSYFPFAEVDAVVPMPNRKATVSFLAERHPEAFPQNDRNDEARLAFLRGTVIPTLNLTDDGNWGLVTKQHGKVPCDVMMWRPSREIVDCLTGTGATWLTFSEPPPDEWQWTSVDVEPPDPTTPPPQPPHTGGDPYSDEQVLGFTDDAYAAYTSVGVTPDRAAAVWIGRMQFDARDIGYAKAREKQLRALKDALGA